MRAPVRRESACSSLLHPRRRSDPTSGPTSPTLARPHARSEMTRPTMPTRVAGHRRMSDTPARLRVHAAPPLVRRNVDQEAAAGGLIRDRPSVGYFDSDATY